MKPFLVLILSFLLALLCAQLAQHKWNYSFAGNLAMGVMLLFTSIGHFAFTKGMSKMLPPIFPFRIAIVYVTGLVEIVTAIALCIPHCRHIAGVVLIIFFAGLLPANIYAALHQVNYEKGTKGGKGLSYLWFRVPLQILFIIWVWYFAI